MRMLTVSQQTEERKRCPRLCHHCLKMSCVGFFFVATAMITALLFTHLGRSSNRNNTKPCPVHPANTSLASTYTITDARLASVRHYPFIGALALARPSVFLCTVAVLNSRYVLTNAACFNPNYKNLIVRLGSDSWKWHGREYCVQSFIVHELYAATMANCVALIKVNTQIEMKAGHILPVPLRAAGSQGGNGVVVGWNYRDVADKRLVRLINLEMGVWSSDDCRQYLEGNKSKLLFKISSFLCGSLDNYACSLETAGALIMNGKLAGIWTWGLSCPDVPSIFVDLGHFQEWILAVIST